MTEQFVYTSVFIQDFHKKYTFFKLNFNQSTMQYSLYFINEKNYSDSLIFHKRTRTF